MRAIHQLVAGFTHGDAISNEALELRRIFRSWGLASEIFAEERRILPELRREARDIASHRADFRPDDVALLHLSIGSRVNELFPHLPCRKAILYHNITPAEYFTAVQEPIARNLAQGREQARALAGAAQVVMADSSFNAAELHAMGFGPVQVLPLVLNLSRLRDKPNRAVLKKYGDGRANILFVGRCAPNKRLEDLLSAFYYFQRYVEGNSRLIHTGSFAGLEAYHAMLLTQSHQLGLDQVEFTGSVRQDELNAMYRSAAVFLCLSDHEGFCIPLLEAMALDVPVVAFAAGAVPETMDGAGVLVREKRFDLIAEVMGRLVRDAALREAVLAGQRERIRRYEARNLADELRRHLQPLLA